LTSKKDASWRYDNLYTTYCAELVNPMLISTTEFVYIDAPNPASGNIPRDVLHFFGKDGPFYEWFTVSEMGDQLGK